MRIKQIAQPIVVSLRARLTTRAATIAAFVRINPNAIIFLQANIFCILLQTSPVITYATKRGMGKQLVTSRPGKEFWKKSKADKITFQPSKLLMPFMTKVILVNLSISICQLKQSPSSCYYIVLAHFYIYIPLMCRFSESHLPKKKSHQCTPSQVKRRLIYKVIVENRSIKQVLSPQLFFIFQAARLLRLNYSTAKTIIKRKRDHKDDGSSVENDNTKVSDITVVPRQLKPDERPKVVLICSTGGHQTPEAGFRNSNSMEDDKLIRIVTTVSGNFQT